MFISGRDRELYFPAYYFFAERRLMNHTIKTLLVKSLDDCEYLCYLDDNCVSLNIKNNENGTHTCELNNSTHLEHDADLVSSPVFYYRGAKVIMTSTVLLHLPNFKQIISRVVTREFLFILLRPTIHRINRYPVEK